MSDVLPFEIAKLSLAPGDVLVVRTPLREIHGSFEAMQKLGAMCREAAGIDCRVLILDSATDLSVLTRTEIEARAR